ncbi:MAG: hypothetical protein R2940_09720 [Syntrophotaleaceae bacterium]
MKLLKRVLRGGGLRTKRAGVCIEDRRWQREFDALDRECELLRERIHRHQSRSFAAERSCRG